MSVTAPRRLAGFRFEDRTPPVPSVLPRMDIAVFVGFASAGPLHVPVAIESLDRFADLFGDDLPLAWNARTRREELGYLAAAVRSFFANGGRRCWVIRVADESAAETSTFGMPGLLEVGANGDLSPATIPARCPGGWADALNVRTALQGTPLGNLSTEQLLTGRLRFPSHPERPVAPGDLLRLHYLDTGWTAFFTVDALEQVQATPLAPRQTELVSNRVRWFRDIETLPLAPQTGFATFLAGDGKNVTARFSSALTQAEAKATVELDLQGKPAPESGSWLGLAFPSSKAWLLVEDLSSNRHSGTPLLRVTGKAWHEGVAPADLASLGTPAIEVLTLSIDAAVGGAPGLRLNRLGLTPNHPRHLGLLDSDSVHFAEPASGAASNSPLHRESDTPRFPLAGKTEGTGILLPLGVHTLFTNVAAKASHSSKTRLEREGLTQFSSKLFLDEALSDCGVDTLVDRADALRYLNVKTRELRGLHAALGIEEATLIAVPDAVHIGWKATPVDGAPVVPPAAPYNAVPTDLFDDCDRLKLDAPALSLDARPDPSSSYSLAWSPVSNARTYVLQEARLPDFRDAVEISEGTATRSDFYGKRPGFYFYQVRAVAGKVSSDWSNRILVEIASDSAWQVVEPLTTHDVPETTAIHRALARLCAARADIVAVLSLPVQLRADDALIYVARLKATLDSPAGIPIRPLSPAEARAWSYVCLYHPWLTVAPQKGGLQDIPPCGALTGLFAKLALARDAGAWIAPANAALADPIALTPNLPRDRWLSLLEKQVNLVRTEPPGVVTLSADTLSDDEDLRLINVRRLLILLRRLALEKGNTYVFEANGDAFRRLVKHTFETYLLSLFQRGAFAGRTASEAFRVDIDGGVNPPQSLDAGRLIVEVRVAPSRPMSFITLRLVQTRDKNALVEIL